VLILNSGHELPAILVNQVAHVEAIRAEKSHHERVWLKQTKNQTPAFSHGQKPRHFSKTSNREKNVCLSLPGSSASERLVFHENELKNLDKEHAFSSPVAMRFLRFLDGLSTPAQSALSPLLCS
jgi:hypothetical protein